MLEDIPLVIFSAHCGMMRWEMRKHVLLLDTDTVQSPVSVQCHPQTSNSSPLEIAQNSYNILRISKSSANAVANFVHAVCFIQVMQFGFTRLTEKRDLAESIASLSFKSHPLKQLEAISFCDRRAHQPSHSLPPAQFPTDCYDLSLYSTKATTMAVFVTSIE